jgi:excinuclease ABC subunit B
MGRAARNVEGKVVLYADKITGSLKRAVDETRRRRKIQLACNEKHGITPQTISKTIHDITDQIKTEREKTAENVLELELKNKKPKQLIKEKKAKMDEAVKVMDFETAAILRDEIKVLESSNAKAQMSNQVQRSKSK